MYSDNESFSSIIYFFQKYVAFPFNISCILEIDNSGKGGG